MIPFERLVQMTQKDLNQYLIEEFKRILRGDTEEVKALQQKQYIFRKAEPSLIGTLEKLESMRH